MKPASETLSAPAPDRHARWLAKAAIGGLRASLALIALAWIGLKFVPLPPALLQAPAQSLELTDRQGRPLRETRAGERFSRGDGIDPGEVENHAAFMQPVVHELHLTWDGVWLVRRQQPKLPPLSKAVGEVGENVGEDFAFASLRTANLRQPNPSFRRSHRGRERARMYG